MTSCTCNVHAPRRVGGRPQPAQGRRVSVHAETLDPKARYDLRRVLIHGHPGSVRHLWPDELDALGEGLERLRAAAPADSLRTLDADASVVPITSRRSPARSRWGGQDLNLRPEDYESPALTD